MLAGNVVGAGRVVADEYGPQSDRLAPRCQLGDLDADLGEHGLGHWPPGHDDCCQCCLLHRRARPPLGNWPSVDKWRCISAGTGARR